MPSRYTMNVSRIRAKCNTYKSHTRFVVDNARAMLAELITKPPINRKISHQVRQTISIVPRTSSASDACIRSAISWADGRESGRGGARQVSARVRRNAPRDSWGQWGGRGMQGGIVAGSSRGSRHGRVADTITRSDT